MTCCNVRRTLRHYDVQRPHNTGFTTEYCVTMVYSGLTIQGSQQSTVSPWCTAASQYRVHNRVLCHHGVQRPHNTGFTTEYCVTMVYSGRHNTGFTTEYCVTMVYSGLTIQGSQQSTVSPWCTAASQYRVHNRVLCHHGVQWPHNTGFTTEYCVTMVYSGLTIQGSQQSTVSPWCTAASQYRVHNRVLCHHGVQRPHNTGFTTEYCVTMVYSGLTIQGSQQSTVSPWCTAASQYRVHNRVLCHHGVQRPHNTGFTTVVLCHHGVQRPHNTGFTTEYCVTMVYSGLTIQGSQQSTVSPWCTAASQYRVHNRVLCHHGVQRPHNTGFTTEYCVTMVYSGLTIQGSQQSTVSPWCTAASQYRVHNRALCHHGVQRPHNTGFTTEYCVTMVYSGLTIQGSQQSTVSPWCTAASQYRVHNRVLCHHGAQQPHNIGFTTEYCVTMVYSGLTIQGLQQSTVSPWCTAASQYRAHNRVLCHHGVQRPDNTGFTTENAVSGQAE